MTVHHQDQRVILHHGDALQVLADLPDHSVDAVVCDPPYALDGDGGMLGQMATGRERCGGLAYGGAHSRGFADNDPHTFQAWCQSWAEQCLRLLRPGGWLLAFGGTRTWHRLQSGVEDAGFDVRDMVADLTGSDAAGLAWVHAQGRPLGAAVGEGWHTTLRPAFEPVTVARAPFPGPVRDLFAEHGAGALHVGACRDVAGRWPANVYRQIPKPSAAERPNVDGVTGPAVKPLELMRWLVRLVTPPGGIVLDPFAGSGATVEAALLEGFRVVAVERDATYLPLTMRRIWRTVLAMDDGEQAGVLGVAAGDA